MSLEIEIPRQFRNDNEFELMNIASTTVETVTQTTSLAQFLISIALAISMKSMWNLMNIM